MFATWLLAVCVGTVCLQSQLAASLTVRNHELQRVLEWKYLDFSNDSLPQKEAVLANTGYVKTANVPLDFDVASDGRMFITIVRADGVPSSLNTVSDQFGDGGPLLKPYPNWDAAKTDCSGIYSVYRVAICKDVLYVIDNGRNSSAQVCPPRLYMFDLKTDKILKNLTIPMDVATNTTTNQGELITPIVDCCNCVDGIGNVYIADVTGYAVVVYHSDTGKFCRTTGGPLNYDPKATTYTVNGQSFELQDGPVGMALSCAKKSLYLSPMSGYNLVAINKTVLDNSCGDIPMQNYPNILPTQSSAKAMSRSGVLFFGLVNSTSIACWNENRRLTEENMIIVAQDEETLQFTSGLKIKHHSSLFGSVERLYALSDRYQKGATGTLNVNEVNFRVLTGLVSNLVYDTRCRPYWFG